MSEFLRAYLTVAVFGATAGAALITVSRTELTRAVGRRLRGAAPSLGWLAQLDAELTVASATTSLGVLLLGAALALALALLPAIRRKREEVFQEED